jgi:Phage tail tube protein, GTA-gp10
MDTAVSLKFGDGEYRFWLPWPQVIELERKCGSKSVDGALIGKSIFTIYDELSAGLGYGEDEVIPVFMGSGKANALDIKEVIRLGLIGGNSGIVDGLPIKVPPLVAAQLVDDYGYPSRPLSECLGVAWAVLHAALIGIEVKKKEEPIVRKKAMPSAKVV